MLGHSLGKKARAGIKSGLESRGYGMSAAGSLDILDKLYDLQKAGTITAKEFQEKKKKILDKI